MINLDFRGAAVYVAMRWENFPLFKFTKVLKKILLVLFILVFILFLYGFLPGRFSEEASRSLLGATIIALSLCVFFHIIYEFVESKLKNPKTKNSLEEVFLNPQNYNLAEFLSFDSAKAVLKSQKSAGKGTASNRLFYHLLQDNPSLNFIFFRLLLNIKEIKAVLKEQIRSQKTDENSDVADEGLREVLLEALKIAKEKKHSKIGIGDIISALARQNLFFKKILITSNIKSEDVENLAWLLEEIEEKIKKQKRFWEYENLAKRGTMVKQWTAGYTITLDKYALDLTEYIRRNPPDLVGHKNEVEQVERVLARREINNALIIGDPGTGRKNMIRALAQKSLMGKSLPGVNYKRVVQLDMSALLAQVANPEEVELVLDRIFSEAVSAGNIILVIDEFHNYIGEVSKLGIIDISGIITPYLRFPEFQIVAVTTYDGFHRNIEKNSSIASLFEKVEVGSISAKDTLMIMTSLIPAIEQRNKIFVSYLAIRDIVSLTDRYFSSLPFPEKALDILDEVVIYVSNLKEEKIVLPKHVSKIIAQKAEVPVGEMDKKERDILLNLEVLIHQRIVNQEEAVKNVATALRRARADITVRKGPMGAFLFLGPTGVGKTETSKALAEFYFGSEKKMIRLDMSEFQEIRDIPRLIGSREELGLLTNPVKETPFSIVLLDEFEKAHPNILNLFLQIFDEGYITDGLGKKIDFKNTILIATSNAGYQIILEALKDQRDWQEVKAVLLDNLFKEGVFRPELINRFDATVVFKPLSKDNLLDIAGLLLNKLSKNLQEKGIEFVITEELKEKVAELGYNPMFGAREMRRVIQEKVENSVASAILSGELTRGSRIEINPVDFKLIVNNN